MSGWSETASAPTASDAWVPQVIHDVGRSAFHASLLSGLRAAVGADHVSHLSYDREGSIRHAAAASLCDQSMIEWTTDVYVNRLYRRDPNYPLVCAAPRQAHGGGGVRVLSLSPERISDAEYRRLLFEKPGFESKVALIGVWGERTCYLNVYFSRTPPAAAGVAALMRDHGATLMALAHRHDELAHEGHEPAPEEDEFSGLSWRERQVADLLRRGHTTKEVGRALGLSPTTVATYKSRLFDKLQVANLKQFLRRPSH
jgi:DNA-binding CsgD family transcriptional regulator